MEILRNVREKYEEHHNVEYTEDALLNCVKLTERYISDRNFPDKALDALDEAGSRAQLVQVKVPDSLLKLEKNLEGVVKDKKASVSKQDYEAAAKYRDLERKIKLNIELETQAWEKDGQKRYTTQINAHVMQMLSSKKNNEQGTFEDDEAPF